MGVLRGGSRAFTVVGRGRTSVENSYLGRHNRWDVLCWRSGHAERKFGQLQGHKSPQVECVLCAPAVVTRIMNPSAAETVDSLLTWMRRRSLRVVGRRSITSRPRIIYQYQILGPGPPRARTCAEPPTEGCSHARKCERVI
jgi:hypothetical protein